MNYTINEKIILKKLLGLDFFLGGATAAVGLLFTEQISTFLGLPLLLINCIAIINLLYALFAFWLFIQKNSVILFVRILISANWFWTIVSIVIVFIHFNNATLFGQLVLILQIFIVGGIAYLEENQIIKSNGGKTKSATK